MTESHSRRTTLIVETITWKPHIETAMEIAFDRREAGERVVYANLRPGLPLCEDSSRWHWLADLPNVRQRASAQLLQERGVEYLRYLHPSAGMGAAQATADRLLAGIRTIEDLRRLSHAGFEDFGWAVLSSAISRRREPQIDPRKERRLLRDIATSALAVYAATTSLLRTVNPHSVILFNGRFASTRAVLRAAQAEGIPVQLHERGCDQGHYSLLDFPIHDIDRLQNLIRREWREELASHGHAFYAHRRQRVERDWHSFTRRQTHGKLPDGLRPGARLVTYFSSSEDEMAAIGDHVRDPRYDDQMQILGEVHALVRSLPDVQLCVRVHPNVARASGPERRRWRQLELDGALLIHPDAPVDSYALLDASALVLTHGSTIGVEATYWGRPSVLLGRSFYDSFGAVHRPTNNDELRHLLQSAPPLPQAACLPYGAFFETYGLPYRHYQPRDLHGGRIAGRDLDADPWIDLLKRPYRWFRRITARSP